VDNSWLDRLDMGFDLGDILSEGPSDGLVPTISGVEPFADAFADAFDASVPCLSFFEEVQQQVAPVQAPAPPSMQAAAQQQQQFEAVVSGTAAPAPAAPAVLPPSPMLGGQQQQMFGGLLGPFPDYMPAQQQMEQQVPSLMQQQYVVRGDMVNALPQMSMIPSMGGMVPAMMMAPAQQQYAAPAQQQYAAPAQQQYAAPAQQQYHVTAMRTSTNGGSFTMGAYSSRASAGSGSSSGQAVRIVRYGDAAGETLSRAERVARYREKRKNRWVHVIVVIRAG
jgi:hypothetical protein